MMSERNGMRQPCTAPELLLKIVLVGTQSHYEFSGIIDEIRLEKLLHAGKQILYKSHQESDVRYVLPSMTSFAPFSFQIHLICASLSSNLLQSCPFRKETRIFSSAAEY